jgi:hypothetical protein
MYLIASDFETGIALIDTGADLAKFTTIMAQQQQYFCNQSIITRSHPLTYII